MALNRLRSISARNQPFPSPVWIRQPPPPPEPDEVRTAGGDNTVTVACAEPEFPAASTTTKLTVVMPIGKIAGAPKDTGAGVYLHKNLGDRVKKGEVFFSIYSNSVSKGKYAVKVFKEIDGISICSIKKRKR